ncbi:MAG: hypothetical protein WCD79_10300 [Chthoniobacteraceae bacterium]
MMIQYPEYQTTLASNLLPDGKAIAATAAGRLSEERATPPEKRNNTKRS